MATTSELIIEIIKPCLDANASISLEKLTSTLEAANFDLSNIGYDNVETLLKDLDESFCVKTTDEGVMVECLGVKTEEESTPAHSPAPTPAPAPVIDEALNKKVNKKLCGIIKKIAKATGDPDSKVTLIALGQERSSQGIELPGTKKLSAYLKSFPELYEVFDIGADTYVKLVEGATPSTVATPLTTVSTSQKRAISLYNISHFAHFDNYADVKKSLTELTHEEKWFIIPDSNEKDPYWIVDYELRKDFAIAVRKQLAGESFNINLGLESAKFTTSFLTPEGKSIILVFKLNQYRDNAVWQTWRFDKIIVE